MNPYDIIFHFYPHDTPLRRLLILHSECVRDKALAILADARLQAPHRFTELDEQLVIDGAMLHDIGIGLTDAPGILCEGTEPYICHGTIGARLLRDYAQQHPEVDATYFERLARICERHTGAGLTTQDILSQQLPIQPVRDLLPESLEEQLVCLADKYYSKSGDPSRAKDFDRIKRSMMKFGGSSLQRFTALCHTFCIN